MQMQDHPSLTILNILLRKGYISVISGEPGTGKTFLCLKAAIKAAEQGDEVVYYAFNESSSCLKHRLEEVFHFKGNITIKEGLSLAREGTAILLEDVINEATQGKMVIVDSLEALMSDVKARQEYRAVLQSLYRAARTSRGRLILISEYPDPYSLAGYAADAYITLYMEIFMGHPYRYAHIKKARDILLEYPFIPFSLFNGFTELFPQEVEDTISFDYTRVLRPGGRYILEIDDSVPYSFVNLQRRFTAAIFLRQGHGVAYFASPEETKKDVIRDVKELVRDASLMKNLMIISRKGDVPEKVDWKHFFQQRNQMMEDIKKAIGIPPISLFTMWFNNLIYHELGDFYPELILNVVKKDKEDGTIAIGYTVKGLPVNEIERQIADEFFLVRRRHGRILIARTKEIPKVAAYILYREEGRPKIKVIPIL